jgi:hypothetical protein
MRHGAQQEIKPLKTVNDARVEDNRSASNPVTLSQGDAIGNSGSGEIDTEIQDRLRSPGQSAGQQELL